MLLVAVRSPAFALDVMVLHAPIESAPAEDRDAWWARARQAAARRPQQRVALVVLVDGNARLGSVLSEAVGGCGADDENCNGAALHEFMGGAGFDGHQHLLRVALGHLGGDVGRRAER